MQSAPPTSNEVQRLDRLRRFGVLDTLPQEAFDHITSLASAICGTPIALISLVDEERQWFKSRVGLEAQQTPRELAFCAHAIHNPDDIFEVKDASRDHRFHDNPLVTEAPDIRFYAGMPIVTGDGFALGTVCVIDRRSRQLNDVQRQALRSLSRLVLTLLENEEAHQAQLAAQVKEAQHQTAVQTSLALAGLDLKSFVGLDRVYRYVNQCYLNYWNKTASDIVGHSIPELMGETVYQTVVQPHFDKAAQGQEVTHEALIEFPVMGPRWMEVTYLPARSDSGEVIGVVVRAHDIHAIRAREATLQSTVEQLEHKTLEQQRFIHIVSHDLREPINTITNFAGLIAEDPAVTLPAHAQRYLAFVQTGGARIKTLLDDLVDFLQMDRHALTLSAVDLASVAEQMRQDLAANIERRSASVTFGALPVVQGDASLLRVLLQNLVANALKFCPRDRKPVVLIEGKQQAGGWVLSVSDNGIGIPAEQSHRIFEMFTRLNNKKDYAGSGLGLSICRRIAELHHGQITVTSIVDEGSRFELTLPAGLSQP
jgi:signal transduction histidine kinase